MTAMTAMTAFPGTLKREDRRIGSNGEGTPEAVEKTGKQAEIRLAFLGDLPLLVRNPGLGSGRM